MLKTQHWFPLVLSHLAQKRSKALLPLKKRKKEKDAAVFPLFCIWCEIGRARGQTQKKWSSGLKRQSQEHFLVTRFPEGKTAHDAFEAGCVLSQNVPLEIFFCFQDFLGGRGVDMILEFVADVNMENDVKLLARFGRIMVSSFNLPHFFWGGGGGIVHFVDA